MDEYPNDRLDVLNADIRRHAMAWAQGLFVASMEEMGRVALSLADAFRALNSGLPPDLDLTAFDDQEGA